MLNSCTPERTQNECGPKFSEGIGRGGGLRVTLHPRRPCLTRETYATPGPAQAAEGKLPLPYPESVAAPDLSSGSLTLQHTRGRSPLGRRPRGGLAERWRVQTATAASRPRPGYSFAGTSCSVESQLPAPAPPILTAERRNRGLRSGAPSSPQLFSQRICCARLLGERVDVGPSSTPGKMQPGWSAESVGERDLLVLQSALRSAQGLERKQRCTVASALPRRSGPRHLADT